MRIDTHLTHMQAETPGNGHSRFLQSASRPALNPNHEAQSNQQSVNDPPHPPGQYADSSPTCQLHPIRTCSHTISASYLCDSHRHTDWGSRRHIRGGGCSRSLTWSTHSRRRMHPCRTTQPVLMATANVMAATALLVAVAVVAATWTAAQSSHAQRAAAARCM